MNKRRTFLLKLAAVVLILAITLAVLGAWIFHSAEAQRSGTLRLQGMEQPARVYYDTWGVPHIDAQTDQDAYRTLGYLHAQDRLFQMDLLRRIGAGRLSELFGQESLATDRFFRSLGISRFARDYARRMEENADAPHVQLINAYQSGINQYIDQGNVPVEYRLLLSKPDYFTTADIAHVMGYMAYSFAEAFKTDALVDHVRGTLGERHMQDLVPGWPDTRPPTSPPAQSASLLGPLLQRVAHVEKHLPVGQFLGSNAWAIKASRSASGAPMLANDPHIGFSVPATWYEAHIRTPEHEVYGHFLAGLPFALLGQTRHHAWGLTMLMNDEVDFYRERVHPDKPDHVWTDNRWQKLTVHEEVIKVRGQEDRLIRMRSSRNGPIINDRLDASEEVEADRRPVSLFWTFLNPESDSTEAFYGFSRASNMAEFEAAAAKHWSPGLNVVYADVEDNIASWAIGRMKRWPKSNNSFALLSGGSDRDKFLGYQPFALNPRTVNPSVGHVYSANHPYDQDNPRRLVPGYYAPSERSQRLAELLATDQPMDQTFFRHIQLDTRRSQSAAMITDALPLLSEELFREELRTSAARARELLAEWNGGFERNSVGATLYQRWHDQLMRALFADELGDQYEFFKNTNMAEKSLLSLYWKPASPWWDNREQPVLDGRQAAVEHAWINTIEALTEQLGTDVDDWKWERVIRLEHAHPLAEKLPFGALLSSDPVPVDGSKESINSMTFALDQDVYQVSAGPSARRLVDLGNLDGTLGILPLGQSGNPFDPHYDDQAALFNEGRYRTQLFDWVSIQGLPDRLKVKPSRKR
ncbi:penicillin acylase family protein [Pseudomonas sp. gcc21]|uniref:penicillin acylase family protein n=1 Tax=Pseudomonas sp. gcc21 TaxID=2726989 RepID=UPI001451D12C|nr:penicillin acylase family protein [Pseudomonas sp. gcc21]QJD58072.1 penicillin acylase family protein [Pseudomonas sp. gcc21]